MCSVSGWVAPPPPTDFSISSLMRPGQARAQGVRAPARAGAEPRHDAVLLSAYLLKLGDYSLNTLHERAVGEYRTRCPALHLPTHLPSY